MPCRLRGTKNSVLRDYVLPDYTHIKRGYVKVSVGFIVLRFCVVLMWIMYYFSAKDNREKFEEKTD